MGNTQSVADGQKIAKPRTVGTTRSSKSCSPSSQADDSSVGKTAAESGSSESPSLLASPTSDNMTEEGARQQALSQLTSRGDGLENTPKLPQVDLLAVSLARSLSSSGSRATKSVSARSSVQRLQNGSQLSVATEKAVDLSSAIAIIHELRKNASPEDMAALRMYTQISLIAKRLC
jgi:hypothetical protein